VLIMSLASPFVLTDDNLSNALGQVAPLKERPRGLGGTGRGLEG
jgi:hypothetical protein